MKILRVFGSLALPLGWSLFGGSLVLASPAAHSSVAQSSASECRNQTPEKAKAAGDGAMLEARYADALVCYESAYAKQPAAALLYNQARALQLIGKPVAAYRFLRDFEREATPELKAKVPALEALKTNLYAQVAEVDITCSIPDASILVNGALVAVTPLSESLVLPPGAATLEIRHAGYQEFRVPLTLVAGAFQRLDVTLTPSVLIPIPAESPSAAVAPPPTATVAPPPTATVAPPPTATVAPPEVVREAASPLVATVPREAPAPGLMRESSAPRGNRWRTAGWSALGIGAVGSVVSVLSYVVLLQAHGDICSAPGPCTQDTYDAEAYDNFRNWSDVYVTGAVVAGVGFAAAGGLLWWTHESEGSGLGSAQIQAGVSPGGVQVKGHF